MKTWQITYYSHGAYRKKLVKADTAEQAIKKARIRNITDLQIIE